MTFFRWGSRNAGRPERKSLFGLSLADPCSTLSLREASRFPSEIGNRESRAPLRVQGGIANRSFKINTLTCPHVFHYVLRKSVRIIVRGHERTEQTRTHTHTHTHTNVADKNREVGTGPSPLRARSRQPPTQARGAGQIPGTASCGTCTGHRLAMPTRLQNKFSLRRRRETPHNSIRTSSGHPSCHEASPSAPLRPCTNSPPRSSR